MFLLNGNTLPQGTPFTANGIQYPANWLNLTTLEEKQAIGITEVADARRYDDRFYWDGDISNPKALEDVTKTVDGKEYTTKGLKSNFIAQVKQTAGAILAQTDWMVIRKAERNVAIPADVVTYRASIVSKATSLETAINAVTTVAQLAALDLSFPSKDVLWQP
jgi:hypothetical protein